MEKIVKAADYYQALSFVIAYCVVIIGALIFATVELVKAYRKK